MCIHAITEGCLRNKERLFTDTVEVIIIQVKYFPYKSVEESLR
jgi:hypothetical protein